MKTGKVEVVFVVDRSGSMGINNRREEVVSEFNNFIRDQKKVEGECLVSFYQFDDVFENVYLLEDIHSIKEMTQEDFVPRGSTSLYDAIGKTINEVGERLKNTDEAERPEKVFISIITDGGENTSKEFKKNDVKELISRQETKYNWTVLFLSEDLEAVEDARSFGNMSNVRRSASVGSAMNKMSGYMSYARSADLNATMDSFEVETEEKEKNSK